MFRRAAALGMGAAGGNLAYSYGAGEKKQVEAFCPCSMTTGLVCCVVGTGVMVKGLWELGGRLIHDQGRVLLLDRAKEDPAAQFAIAGIAMTHREELAMGYLMQCSDAHPDCAALYALLLSESDREKTHIDDRLVEAAKGLKKEFNATKAHFASEGTTISSLPPPRPGMVGKELSADDLEVMHYVSAPYTLDVLYSTAARALMLGHKTGFSKSATDALYYICAVRGFLPFYYMLGRRAESPTEAANFYAQFLQSRTVDENQVILQHVQSVISQPLPPGSNVQQWRSGLLFWWTLQYASARAELNVLEPGQPSGDHVSNFSVTDLVGPLLQFEGMPMPENIQSVMHSTHEQCSRAEGASQTLEDKKLCSESLKLLADYFYEDALSALPAEAQFQTYSMVSSGSNDAAE